MILSMTGFAAASAELPGARVLAHVQSVAEIGGDYYDYLPVPDGRSAIVVGDVSGHGLPTGLLVAMAKARGMRMMSLELVDEQIAAFDAVPVDSQVAMLKHALAHRDALVAMVEPTIDAWLRGDLATLAKLPDQAGHQFPGMAVHYRAFAKHVIDGRTALMHYRLFIPLREGRVFTAVGATHLYGKRGLLALIQQDGYRVTKVW